MSIGAVLVGLSMALVATAYLARPFRVARIADDLDQVIEDWVAQVGATEPETEAVEVVRGAAPSQKGEPILFCPQCGRHVGPDDRYCTGCGTRLRGGVA